MKYENEDKKRDEGRPVIGNPGAAFNKISSFGKSPAFSKAAGSIMDKLKNLSKKDLAFVTVGLGVLVMAPVAEYMMSKPVGPDQLAPGFGVRSEGGSGALYEPGINALSQGSPDGSGEVITPLSARDPASLILGAPSSQPIAAAQTSLPPKTDYRDSMKDSARAAFNQASRSAGVPTVIPKMQSSLRALGSFGGEGSRTSGSLSGGKILDSARGASGKAASRSMVGPVATAGYKGVSASLNSASKGAFEKLRGQADKAAGNFNGGSSISSLDKAAADSVDLGKGLGGSGGGSEGEKYRAATGTSIRDSKSASDKETLAELLAKNAALKAQEWEFYKKYEIPKKIIEAMLAGFNGVLTEAVKGATESLFGMNSAPAAERFCWSPANNLASTDPSDCRTYGAIGDPFLKDKGEKSTNTQLPPGRSCACGFNTVQPTIGSPANSGSNSASASAAPGAKPSSSPSAAKPGSAAGIGSKPVSAAKKVTAVESFDAKMVTVLQRVQEAGKKGDSVPARDLLAYNKGISETLETAIPDLVKTLDASLQGVSRLASGDISKLGSESQKSASQIAAAESETDSFISEMRAEIANPGNLSKKKGEALTGGSAQKADLVETEGAGFGEELDRHLKRAENTKNVWLVSAKKHSVFNERAQKLYAQQGAVLREKIGALRDRAQEISEEVKKISGEAKAINPEEADQKKDAVCKQFSELSGMVLSACRGTAAPEAGKSVVDALMKLRGAEGVADNALNDKNAVEAEAAAWASASPKLKLDSDIIEDQSESMDPPQDNIAACLLRANHELPPDVAVLVGNPANSVAGPTRAASSDIQKSRKAVRS